MKCNTLLAIFLLITFFSAAQSKFQSDLEVSNLKGSVKSIKEISYKAIDKFGNIQKGEKNREKGFDYYIDFNKSGYKIEEKNYSPTGDIFQRQIFKYDTSMNLIESNLYNSIDSLKCRIKNVYDTQRNKLESNIYNSVGTLAGTCIMKYDNNSNKIEIKVYYSEEVDKQELTFFFNNEGNIRITEFSVIDNEPSFHKKFQYKFNDKNKLVEKITFQSEDTLFNNKETYIFDEKDNVIEDNTIFRASEKKNKQNIYKYDEQGNMIEKITYKESTDKEISNKLSYKYDNSGRVTEKSEYYLIYKPNLSDMITVFNYDKNGKKTEFTIYKPDGNISAHFVYRYDSNGKQTISEKFSDLEKNLNRITKYDSFGNKIEEVWNKSNGNIDKFTYKYEYDSIGNWTKQVQFYNNKPTTQIDKPQYIKERELIYY